MDYYCMDFHCVYCTAHGLGQCLLRMVCIGISFFKEQLLLRESLAGNRDSVSVAEMLLWDLQNLIVSPASKQNYIRPYCFGPGKRELREICTKNWTNKAKGTVYMW